VSENFATPCEAARAAFELAEEGFLEARAAWDACRASSGKAREAAEEARAAREAAEAARQRAELDWDAHIARLRANPSLGVEEVEAGITHPRGRKPAGSTATGIIPVRVRTPLTLWGRSSLAEPWDHWSRAAEDARTRAALLEEAAGEAALRAASCREAAAEAEERVQTAESELAEARTQYEAARRGLEQSLRALHRACRGQIRIVPLPGPTDLVVHPGRKAADERAVRELFASLPRAETRGITKIELPDAYGPLENREDPDGGKPLAIRPAAEFLGPIPSVSVFRLHPGCPIREMVPHLVGLHVFRARLPSEARERWSRYWSEGRTRGRSPAGKMPDDLAGLDPAQGFAESYAALRRDPDSLLLETRLFVEQLLEEIR